MPGGRKKPVGRKKSADEKKLGEKKKNENERKPGERKKNANEKKPGETKKSASESKPDSGMKSTHRLRGGSQTPKPPKLDSEQTKSTTKHPTVTLQRMYKSAASALKSSAAMGVNKGYRVPTHSVTTALVTGFSRAREGVHIDVRCSSR